MLSAYVDSDWAVAHATTGYACKLAGAAVGHSSKRQQCISTSSTEAEIVAASACALEIMYFRGLLQNMGLEQPEPTVLLIDNTGAISLSRDRKSCNKSRHIDRRFFKVRELEAAGVLVTRHVPTEDNAADMLTKHLPYDVFQRHLTNLMGDGSRVAEGGEDTHTIYTISTPCVYMHMSAP
jgi:hypothetical protein